MTYLINLAIILITAKICGHLATRFALPEALGQILGGIAIGPLLNIVTSSSDIEILSNLGVIFLLFLAGLDTNPEELRRIGKSSFVVALSGVIVPLFSGYFLGLFYGYPKITALFLGGVLTATSVGLTTSILIEMNKLHTKEGTTILAAAVIDDVLGIIVLAILIAIKRSGHISLKELSLLGGEIALYFTLSWFIGSSLVKRIIALSEKIALPETITSVAIAITLILAYFAEEIGIAAITGAYLAGLLLNKTPQAHRIGNKVNAIAYALFVPVFLVSIGINTKLETLSQTGLFTLMYSLVAILTKMVGCGGGALLTRFKLMEALKVGIGMIPRMEVGLIIANMALAERIFDDSTFTTTVGMTMITTLITPPLLKWAFSKD